MASVAENDAEQPEADARSPDPGDRHVHVIGRVGHDERQRDPHDEGVWSPRIRPRAFAQHEAGPRDRLREQDLGCAVLLFTGAGARPLR